MRLPSHSSAASVKRVGLVVVVVCAAAGCDAAHVRLAAQPGADASSSPEQPAVRQWVRARTHAAVGGGRDDAGQPPIPAPPPDSGASPIPPTPDAGQSQPEPPLPAAQLVLSDAPVSARDVQTRTTFSIATLSELYVYTRWFNLVGEHTERRKFIQPSGDVYYQKLLAFSTEIDAPAPFDKPVDVPHSKEVQPVSLHGDGTLVVEDYLAVAGAWISDHTITGQWQLEVYLDDATRPNATQPFELVP